MQITPGILPLDDVTIIEEVESSYFVNVGYIRNMEWVASFSGRPTVNKVLGNPEVSFSRKGKTAEEAFENLKKAAAEQGWEFQ